MTFKQWLNRVRHLTMAQIRCDVPPSEEVLRIIDETGLDQYDRFASRLERHIVKDRWQWPEQ